MVVNKNIIKIKSIGNKYKYEMDCINEKCNNRFSIIESKFLSKDRKPGLAYFSCGNKECTYCKEAIKVQKENMKERYGVENSFQLEKSKQSAKSTWLKKAFRKKSSNNSTCWESPA